MSLEFIIFAPSCFFNFTTKTAWDRDDCAFASVGCCVRREFPSLSHVMISSGSLGVFSDNRAILIVVKGMTFNRKRYLGKLRPKTSKSS